MGPMGFRSIPFEPPDDDAFTKPASRPAGHLTWGHGPSHTRRGGRPCIRTTTNKQRGAHLLGGGGVSAVRLRPHTLRGLPPACVVSLRLLVHRPRCAARRACAMCVRVSGKKRLSDGGSQSSDRRGRAGLLGVGCFPTGVRWDGSIDGWIDRCEKGPGPGKKDHLLSGHGAGRPQQHRLPEADGRRRRAASRKPRLLRHLIGHRERKDPGANTAASHPPPSIDRPTQHSLLIKSTTITLPKTGGKPCGRALCCSAPRYLRSGPRLSSCPMLRWRAGT